MYLSIYVFPYVKLKQKLYNQLDLPYSNSLIYIKKKLFKLANNNLQYLFYRWDNSVLDINRNLIEASYFAYLIYCRENSIIGININLKTANVITKRPQRYIFLKGL